MINNKYSKRYLRIFSRHPSHTVLRKKNNGVLCDALAVVRFGSTTNSNKKIQINSVEAIKNSSNKYLMKKCFDSYEVSTALWLSSDQITNINTEGISSDNLLLKFPVVAKNIYGSRGKGNSLINSLEGFNLWKAGRNLNNYIYEKFYNYSKEYRLHITTEGCFYTCRKMLKNDAKERWYRNDSNCVWILEDNKLFNKPSTWDIIINDCVKALKSTGLDVGACDVKVNNKGQFIIIEINSAASFGLITEQKYREVLPKLVKAKANNS
jgi:glutathione synthase/RimK-type ligase-like ATP-grasp enzyme